MDEIAEITGIKPTLILSAEDVAEVRKVRADEERAAAQAQMAQQMVQGAAALGKTPAPAPDNALGTLLGSSGLAMTPGGLPA